MHIGTVVHALSPTAVKESIVADMPRDVVETVLGKSIGFSVKVATSVRRWTQQFFLGGCCRR